MDILCQELRPHRTKSAHDRIPEVCRLENPHETVKADLFQRGLHGGIGQAGNERALRRDALVTQVGIAAACDLNAHQGQGRGRVREGRHDIASLLRYRANKVIAQLAKECVALHLFRTRPLDPILGRFQGLGSLTACAKNVVREGLKRANDGTTVEVCRAMHELSPHILDIISGFKCKPMHGTVPGIFYRLSKGLGSRKNFRQAVRIVTSKGRVLFALLRPACEQLFLADTPGRHFLPRAGWVSLNNTRGQIQGLAKRRGFPDLLRRQAFGRGQRSAYTASPKFHFFKDVGHYSPPSVGIGSPMMIAFLYSFITLSVTGRPLSLKMGSICSRSSSVRSGSHWPEVLSLTASK